MGPDHAPRRVRRADRRLRRHPVERPVERHALRRLRRETRDPRGVPGVPGVSGVHGRRGVALARPRGLDAATGLRDARPRESPPGRVVDLPGDATSDGTAQRERRRQFRPGPLGRLGEPDARRTERHVRPRLVQAVPRHAHGYVRDVRRRLRRRRGPGPGRRDRQRGGGEHGRRRGGRRRPARDRRRRDHRHHGGGDSQRGRVAGHAAADRRRRPGRGRVPSGAVDPEGDHRGHPPERSPLGAQLRRQGHAVGRPVATAGPEGEVGA